MEPLKYSDLIKHTAIGKSAMTTTSQYINEGRLKSSDAIKHIAIGNRRNHIDKTIKPEFIPDCDILIRHTSRKYI